jgi:hypothetical protein
MDGYTPGAVGTFQTSLSTLDWPAALLSYDSTSMSIFLQCTNAPGSTTISLVSPGNYEIDSFFDVWPEISFDDSNWIPADESVRMTIGDVPEPSVLVFFGLGTLTLIAGIRRGRK